jgi:hypothetical protein
VDPGVQLMCRFNNSLLEGHYRERNSDTSTQIPIHVQGDKDTAFSEKTGGRGAASTSYAALPP